MDTVLSRNLQFFCEASKYQMEGGGQLEVTHWEGAGREKELEHHKGRWGPSEAAPCFSTVAGAFMI